jgi:hypothetical protein
MIPHVGSDHDGCSDVWDALQNQSLRKPGKYLDFSLFIGIGEPHLRAS